MALLNAYCICSCDCSLEELCNPRIPFIEAAERLTDYLELVINPCFWEILRIRLNAVKLTDHLLQNSSYFTTNIVDAKAATLD